MVPNMSAVSPRVYVSRSKATHDPAARNTVPYSLSWEMVLEHVRGISRIGAVPSAEARRWLMFDVDAHDCPEQRARGTTWRLKDLLTSLELHVFVCRSGGGKGYHLWLFFEKPLPAKEVNEFGRAVRDLIQQKRHARIDVPGAGMDTQAVCLPMGYNPKTGVWSEWLYSRTLTPVEDSVSYLQKRGRWWNTEETFLDALKEVRATVQKLEANEATEVSRSISDPESGSHSVKPQPADLTPEESEWIESAPRIARDTLRALVDFERTFAEKGVMFYASQRMIIEHIVQRGGEKICDRQIRRHIGALCKVGMMVRGKSGKKAGQASEYRVCWP